MKKNILIGGLVAVVFVGGAGAWYATQPQLPVATEYRSIATVVPTPLATTATTVVTAPVVTSASAEPLPQAFQLKVPFYAQAPFGNWDLPWQEACEEASVLLAANVYFGHNWTREQFNQQILDLVEWQKATFGGYEHTDMEQTSKILNDYLGLDSKIIDNPTFDQVKATLARGHLVVMPFAGKQLGNPYYSNGGPVYHVILIKGYTKDNQLITHDVGTRRGENYLFPWSVIEAANHDYAQPIESGVPRMIEIIPPSA
ncbi:C39 family peptidase [Candidatus Gracilibacteria bacterium]|nr:C39 family peptidase [Candidatus Gracilibacteria bacterium]